MKLKKMFLMGLFLGLLQLSFADEKVINIGVQNFEDYMPYSQYQNKEFTGFERDLLDMFSKKYGYKFIYTALPVKRLYDDFLSGAVDMKMPDNEYWSKDMKVGKNIKYSNPIIKYIDGVMVLPDDKDIKVDRIKNLGTALGYTPFAYLELIKTGKIKLSENPNLEGLLKQLLIKRIDGAYINIAVANYYSKDHLKATEKIVFNPNLPHTKSTRHISSIKYPEVIDKFNEFLTVDKKDIDKLKEKYNVEAGVE